MGYSDGSVQQVLSQPVYIAGESTDAAARLSSPWIVGGQATCPSPGWCAKAKRTYVTTGMLSAIGMARGAGVDAGACDTAEARVFTGGRTNV